MNSRAIVKNLSTYSLTHALIDAACAATVLSLLALGILEGTQFLIAVILYNFLAFGLQAPFGLLADKTKKPTTIAIIGSLFVAFATLITTFPWVAVVLAGLGNALFHVGGGVISLNLQRKKAALPGIFVAPGAAGLLIGGLIGTSGSFIAWPFVFLLLLACLAMAKVPRPKIFTQTKINYELKLYELLVILIFLSVAIRGLIGLSLVLPWKSQISLLIVLTIAVVLGKALGGVLGDRFGWKNIAIGGLLLSAPLLSFGSSLPVLGIIGAFLFNLTMPITLVALSNILPGRAGFAFGLTTLALILGALPTYTSAKSFIGQIPVVFITLLISASLLYIALSMYFKKYEQVIP